ncbi:PTS sugar transporter subunit IIA [Sporolactobacillus sp. KGMB 08714]|uniref:PTS sugar transporter subunit IIA n=1 Tax=Sporolactobacillus sp. KGMB 08714 TaxID=3064704 RepID=UPI002FBDACF7
MAKKIVLVGHDGLAEGMKKAIEFIAGRQDNILVLSMKSDGLENFKKNFTQMMNEIPEADDILLVSDIPSGSPGTNGYSTALKLNKKVTYLTGMNLAMVLELALSSSSPYQKAIQSAKASIMNMGDTLKAVPDDHFMF